MASLLVLNGNTHDIGLSHRMARYRADALATFHVSRAERPNGNPGHSSPAAGAGSTGRPVDVGDRLGDLGAAMCCIAGAAISFDLEIGLPESRVRLDPYDFDGAMLAMLAEAAASGARDIVVRMHKVGARIWIFAHYDGRTAQPPALVAVRHLARRAHGQVLARTSPSTGNSVALILPAVLSICAGDKAAPPWSIVPKQKEKCHEEDRQRVAA